MIKNLDTEEAFAYLDKHGVEVASWQDYTLSFETYFTYTVYEMQQDGETLYYQTTEELPQLYYEDAGFDLHKSVSRVEPYEKTVTWYEEVEQ